MTQQVSWAKQFHEKKIMYKFHEEKNQDAISFTSENQHTTSSTKKKSKHYKLLEQNQFHEEKNQCKSFKKCKINVQQVSRTKTKSPRD